MASALIDIGSSNIKAALLEDGEGDGITATISRPFPERLPDDNARVFCVKADLIYRYFIELVEELSEHSGRIERVLFATQMHGCVYYERRYGCHVYLSWQDARCLDFYPGRNLSFLDELKQMFPSSAFENTGVPLKPALALCNLYALKRQEPEIFYSGDMMVFTLGSYLIWRLTGKNISHITNAAPLGALDITRSVWRRDVWKRALGAQVILPEITNELNPCGQFCLKNGDMVSIYPDIGDQQAAIFGCDPLPGDVIVNIGTAGQIIRLCDGITRAKKDYRETRPYFNGAFLDVVSRMPSGRNLDIIANFIEEAGRSVFHTDISREELWARLIPHMRTSAHTTLEADIGFYDLPERDADGAIRHIHRGNLTLENLFAALFRDMGRVYSHYIAEMLDGAPLSRLIFCGGVPSKFPMIPALIREALNDTLASPVPSDLTIQAETIAGLARIAHEHRP